VDLPMCLAGLLSYKGEMTTNATSTASTDRTGAATAPSIGEAVLGALATRNFTQLASLLEPDVTLFALLPDGLHEWHGPDRVVAAFIGWFGRADRYELLRASIGNVGPRLQLQWHARVSGGPYGEGNFVVQQHLYADPGPTNRISEMAMLCSGFAREHDDD
jgi:hypothetical protein